jgi:hypothetical protein
MHYAIYAPISHFGRRSVILGHHASMAALLNIPGAIFCGISGLHMVITDYICCYLTLAGIYRFSTDKYVRTICTKKSFWRLGCTIVLLQHTWHNILWCIWPLYGYY